MKSIALFFLIIICYSAKAQLVYPNLYVQYDSAWQFQNLQLIPIKFKGNAIMENKKIFSTNVTSLQQAMQQNKVSIKEIKINKGADVSVLVIKNNTGKNILINTGELIAGGKQDRVVAETKMILAQREEQYIAVFCAEKGRWDDKAKPFTYAGSVDMGLRNKIDTDKRQHEIWKTIEQQFASMNETSETLPYLQLKKKMDKADTAYMNYFIKKMQQSDSSYAGFIAVTSNRIIAVEVFALPQYTTLFFKNMLSSFVHSIKKNDNNIAINNQQIKKFANDLFADEETQKQFLQLHGKADKLQNKTIHLIAYGY